MRMLLRVLPVALLVVFAFQWAGFTLPLIASNETMNLIYTSNHSLESVNNRNQERTEMIRRGCMLKTKNLSFSTLREIQYNLTNDLGTDTFMIQVTTCS